MKQLSLLSKNLVLMIAVVVLALPAHADRTVNHLQFGKQTIEVAADEVITFYDMCYCKNSFSQYLLSAMGPIFSEFEGDWIKSVDTLALAAPAPRKEAGHPTCPLGASSPRGVWPLTNLSVITQPGVQWAHLSPL